MKKKGILPLVILARKRLLGETEGKDFYLLLQECFSIELSKKQNKIELTCRTKCRLKVFWKHCQSTDMHKKKDCP